MEHRDQDEVQNDIQRLRDDANGHAEPFLSAHAQVIIQCKADRNKRAEHRIDPEIFHTEADRFFSSPGCDEHNELPCKKEAHSADDTGKSEYKFYGEGEYT